MKKINSKMKAIFKTCFLITVFTGILFILSKPQVVLADNYSPINNIVSDRTFVYKTISEINYKRGFFLEEKIDICSTILGYPVDEFLDCVSEANEYSQFELRELQRYENQLASIEGFVSELANGYKEAGFIF